MRKIEKVFIVLEIIFYILGSIELLVYNPNNVLLLLSCILFVIVNTALRQFFIYRKEKHFKYSVVSIIIQLIVVGSILFLSDSAVVTLFFCTIIFEVVFINSIYISIIITILSAVILFVWFSTVTEINSIIYFILNGFYSFGLALVLIFSVGLLVKVQMREKQKVMRANQELELAYQKLLLKSSKIKELSIDNERLRMAREIHDTLAHTFTAVVVQLEACKKLIGIDLDRAFKEIEKAQNSTRDGLNDIKRTIKALRPRALENRTFIDAVLTLIDDVKENMNIEVKLTNKKIDVPAFMEVPLFRVIQETITNSMRHGNAKHITIDIFESDEYLILNMSDDGAGCNLIKEGFGLKGIIERIGTFDGTVEFYSTLGKGFRTNIWVPIKGGFSYD
ncbi:sensor histidine kinase [Mycoplasmatota bacterium]|nr:sensor histidine kinase [Mycoplasmatota bacterium]